MDASPLFVQQLPDVPSTDGVADRYDISLVHRTPAAQVCVQRVPLGGSIDSHHHSAVWDYFVGLSGEGAVVVTIEGATHTYSLTANSFLAVPPGCMHQVCNAGTAQDFVFLLVQAPFSEYDFVSHDR